MEEQLTQQQALEQGYSLCRRMLETESTSIDTMDAEDIAADKYIICEKEPYKVNNKKGEAFYRLTNILLVP